MSHATTSPTSTTTMDGPVAPRAGVVRLVPLAFDAVTLDPGSFLGRWQSVNR